METPAPAWHAAYPAPRNQQPDSITSNEVLEMINAAPSAIGKQFVLVDLRRTDHEGGTIRGSINLPAQSLYPTIATIYNLVKSAGIQKVIWYCSSSKGRGTRAAGWFSDYLTDHGDQTIQSLVLLGGIRGWVAGGPKFVECVDEYDASFWVEK